MHWLASDKCLFNSVINAAVSTADALEYTMIFTARHHCTTDGLVSDPIFTKHRILITIQERSNGNRDTENGKSQSIGVIDCGHERFSSLGSRYQHFSKHARSARV
jgi:hypothetical protein